jgi:hypothetical protein
LAIVLPILWKSLTSLKFTGLAVETLRATLRGAVLVSALTIPATILGPMFTAPPIMEARTRAFTVGTTGIVVPSVVARFVKGASIRVKGARAVIATIASGSTLKA